MDIVDKATRSRMMSNIRGRDTRPEVMLRKALHRLGFRFRLHVKGLPGKPDIVLPKYRASIFTHGCFWHRHHGCRLATSPATRAEFWNAKFTGNVERDGRVRDALNGAGWRVATVWECALRKPQDAILAAEVVAEWLSSEFATLEIGSGDLNSDRA
ncbi:very short patch repair endonuclease [Rhizobium ruizarguesonis]|uniref:very short patch repair endonuclease n=1 Tax=Rhizobium ruizarguesonis TaxID=2081791 RepID=UPI0013EE6A99|nr:DNA mismatch endonuclease Vsr [Rhizobium ruizarguesonis]